jgi:hypothetical protein
MNSAVFIIWAIAGWCGTPYPRWWPHPPIPDPEPWWRSRLIGVIAGIIGGWAFTQVFGPHPEPWTVVTTAATAAVAFLASRLAGDIYGLVRGSSIASEG